MSVQPSQEEIDSELARLDALRRELRESRRKIKALEKRRPYCQQPGNCAAKARGACSVCHHALMSAARKAAWADPEVRARMSAASKAALADPEVRARMKLLPQFTAEQKKLYRKLRKFVSRDEALAEVLK